MMPEVTSHLKQRDTSICFVLNTAYERTPPPPSVSDVEERPSKRRWQGPTTAATAGKRARNNTCTQENMERGLGDTRAERVSLGKGREGLFATLLCT